jgi:hypothetical protein
MKELDILLQEFDRLVKFYMEELNNADNTNEINFYAGKLAAFSHSKLILELTLKEVNLL